MQQSRLSFGAETPSKSAEQRSFKDLKELLSRLQAWASRSDRSAAPLVFKEWLLTFSSHRGDGVPYIIKNCCSLPNQDFTSSARCISVR